MSGDAFRAALKRQPAPHTPVWFMRQAGRYMPEYRAIRAKASLLEICHRPELACEVTLQPVQRIGVDAAIIFADILLPFEPLGLGLTFAAGEGPVIQNAIRGREHVDRLRRLDPEADLGHVLEAIRLAKRALNGLPLIGFAGAPFTLAAYALEGGASRSFGETKKLMLGDTETWHSLLDRFATMVGEYLAAQVRAGADVVQVFDSWVGALTREEYQQYVLPHSRKAITLARAAGAPVIHFGTGTSGFLDLMAAAGGDVIGVDWRIPLDDAWRVFPDRGIQGNLDPNALLGPMDQLTAQVRDVMQRADGRPGHIFNLGHGILPDTDPERARAVVDLVHERSAAPV